MMNYYVGCGICRDDFNIDDISLASFASKDDACDYVKNKFYNNFSSNKFYYIDGPEGREFFDDKRNEFTKKIKDIYVYGYEVVASYRNYDELGEIEYDSEKNYCITHTRARLFEKEYIDDGAYEVDISDDAEINVDKNFWNVKDFYKPKDYASTRELLLELKISEITPFHGYPYLVKDDANMMELVESIKTNGVMEPAIAFVNEDKKVELVSGHRRMRACELAGIDTMPVIVKDISRDQAVKIMVKSNMPVMNKEIDELER